jgi:predicted nuclease with TOPRIM domain
LDSINVEVSDLEAALQKTEQEVSSAKTKLLEMQANLVKANEQATNALGSRCLRQATQNVPKPSGSTLPDSFKATTTKP